MPTFYALLDLDAVLDWTIDWSDVFPSGDDISTSAWTLDDELTEDNSTNTATTSTLWVSVGADGVKGGVYDATCHATTDAGREDDRTIRFTVYEA